jgi:hypothetical protein
MSAEFDEEKTFVTPISATILKETSAQKEVGPAALTP